MVNREMLGEDHTDEPIIWKIISCYFGYDDFIALGDLVFKETSNEKYKKKIVLTTSSSSSTNVKQRARIRTLCSSESVLK
jgi:predicted metallo-beta-lactamase superfamily hydrolase